MDEHENQKEQEQDYEEPSIIDVEELEDVSGGSICVTGGSGQQAYDPS